MPDIGTYTREQKILSLARQVNLHANRACTRNGSIGDVNVLRSEAWIGAMHAVDRYDNRTDCTLASFAEHKIRGRIKDYFRGVDTLSRDHRKEIAAEKSQPVSTIGLNREALNYPALPSADAVMATIDIAIIFSGSAITARGKFILECKYQHDMSLSEIGILMHLSEGRISQLLKKAMKAAREFVGIA